MRRLATMFLPIVALALVAAACGDSGEDGTTTTLPPPTTTLPPVTTTTVAPTTTAPPVTTTTLAPTTTSPPTTTPPTTAAPDPFVVARTTLDAVLAECNVYSAEVNGFEPFDGSADDPTVGGEFVGEVEAGIFEFVDADGITVLVDTNEGVLTGEDGPEGIAPRPYSFWCPPELFPGTLDEGEPGVSDAMTLYPGGVGDVVFGVEAETAIGELTAALGEPDDDSGWIPSFSGFGTCPGDEVRVLRWDELEAYFTDSAQSLGFYPDPGGPHFFTWRAATFIDDAPPARGFATPEGVAPGTPLSLVREIYGDANVEVSYEDAFDIWFLNVAGPGLGGTTSGESDNDLVESLQGGIGCGE